MADQPVVDVLSDVFELVQVQGMLTGGFAVSGAWVSRGRVTRPLKFIAVVAGAPELTTDGPGGPDGPVCLGPGDVVLLNGRTHLEIRGGGDQGPVAELLPEAGFDSMALAHADVRTDDILVGGWIQMNAAGLALLSGALPPLVHVAASSPSASRLAGIVHRLFEEGSGRRLGAEFAIRQNAQLLLLEVLRSYLGQEEVPTGWLRLLTDESLRPALRLIHEQPGAAWGLAELARAAGMSRTTFAERFRRTAGTTPLAYVARWRMLLAQRALRDPHVRIGPLAAQLGYGSESAFSTAFKREVGEAPRDYRGRQLEHA
jgi:AraC-like DNA-binding protein